MPFVPLFTHLPSLFHVSISAHAVASGFCAWMSLLLKAVLVVVCRRNQKIGISIGIGGDIPGSLDAISKMILYLLGMGTPSLSYFDRDLNGLRILSKDRCK
jgi:hypothetical protein